MLSRSPSLLLAAVALVLTAGCASPPPDLDLSLQHPSANGRFIVALQPPPKPAAINQLHSWQIRLTTADGAPVQGARIAIDGGMPQHGHGLPTRPQVTQQLADGSYLLEGMKFSMGGWWEIKLNIEAAQGSDKVTFNTVVAQPKAGL
ncbi:FixH family protein [Roseateles toxinivorans]|uniref:YtkA-like protein n=1 Tax=Roseateles toxinivorans TaxID=270368 RepID=A0A4R6QKN6_9BURK|nr:FixH family protein [Roseateles toxinivorans]TDP63887.1 YtkA-like protein [Roseateles toxinivorans]